MKGKSYIGDYSHVNVNTSGVDAGKLNFDKEDKVKVTIVDVIGCNISIQIEFDYVDNKFTQKRYAYGIFTGKNKFEFIQESGHGTGCILKSSLVIRFYDTIFKGKIAPGGNIVKLQQLCA